MKKFLLRFAALILREMRQPTTFLPCLAVALSFTTSTFPTELSPGDGIRQFFDLLLKQKVREAAKIALFSDEEAESRFIEEWTESVKSLSAYAIEEWAVEPTGGSAEVSLQFRGRSDGQSMEVVLVKRQDLWKVAPEKDFEPDAPTSASPPTVENLENLVDVTSLRKERRIELSVTNRSPFSLLFRLDMDLPASLRPDRPLPLQGILAPSDNSVSLCNLQVVGRSGTSYSWSYTVKRADDLGEAVPRGTFAPLPEVSVEEDTKFFVGEEYAYGLPYPAGEGYFIWQGPGGSFSHSEPGSRYAVDFSMPLGSEVAAARAGVVIGLVEKNPNNPDEKPAPASMANEALILHADGTIGVYAHLTTDGAKVAFGETVRRGQVIGISGNSGYSRGPHLHFDVLGYEGRRCVSFPFDFLSSEGSVITPREGLVLRAEKDGTATIAKKETSPRRVVHKAYQEFDTEIRYFAKTVEFLGINKLAELLGIELSFSSLENAVSLDALPRRVALPPDGKFHPILTLQLTNPGETSSFAYVFRRVEPPGKEHIPLRVERDAANGYIVEIRYFSDRVELYAENTTSRPMEGFLGFPSLTNVAPKEEIPRKVSLPANGASHYLATLVVVQPTKGYSFTYNIGPSKAETRWP